MSPSLLHHPYLLPKYMFVSASSIKRQIAKPLKLSQLRTQLWSATSLRAKPFPINQLPTIRMSSNPPNSKELDPNQNGDSTKKTYNKQATGLAWETVQSHSAENDLKLYGSCFCPFVHRVWISLEHKGLAYQYVEVDVYRKPKLLLDINPRGLVPALRHGDWGSYESTVLMEYLEDLNEGKPLLPSDPKLRADSRLWSDHINRHIIPLFYKYLQAQDSASQISFAGELTEQIGKLVSAADPTGPYFMGNEMTFVDVQIAPWVVRLQKVLKPYRGWPEPEPGSRWEKWVRAIERNDAVKNTTSDDQLYLDSYERYAENRPNTSQVQAAVNSGKGLP
jgi:glutathione S-transferase